MEIIKWYGLREKICCFTGHRKIPADELEGVQARLEQTIKELYHRGVIFFGAGGALGFDSLAAETVLHLREQPAYSRIKLILVLPCHSQTSKWNQKDDARYQDILHRADKVVYVSQEFSYASLFKRNRHLVDGSSVCVCYQTRYTGGTAYTIGYAEKMALRS